MSKRRMQHAWAEAAVSAGMKYAVLAAKHVSGFCLWDSKYPSVDLNDLPILTRKWLEGYSSRRTDHRHRNISL
jgi:hypothetical protein